MPTKNRLPIIVLLENHEDDLVIRSYSLIMRQLQKAGYNTLALEWPEEDSIDMVIEQKTVSAILSSNLMQQTAEYLSKTLRRITKTDDPKKILDLAKEYLALPETDKSFCTRLILKWMNKHAQYTPELLTSLTKNDLQFLLMCTEDLWTPAPAVIDGITVTDWSNINVDARRKLMLRQQGFIEDIKLYKDLRHKMQLITIDQNPGREYSHRDEEFAQRDRVMAYNLASKYIAGRNIVFNVGKQHLPGLFAELSAHNLSQNVLFFDLNSPSDTTVTGLTNFNNPPRCLFFSTPAETFGSLSLFNFRLTPGIAEMFEAQTNQLAIEAKQAKFKGYPFIESLWIENPNNREIADCIVKAAHGNIFPVEQLKIKRPTEPLVFRRDILAKPQFNTPANNDKNFAASYSDTNALLSGIITAGLLLFGLMYFKGKTKHKPIVDSKTEQKLKFSPK